MPDARRPLEAHEVSYLLAQRIQPAPAAAALEMSQEEWQDVLLHTPMGRDPVEYAPLLKLMRTPVGARR